MASMRLLAASVLASATSLLESRSAFPTKKLDVSIELTDELEDVFGDAFVRVAARGRRRVDLLSQLIDASTRLVAVTLRLL